MMHYKCHNARLPVCITVLQPKESGALLSTADFALPGGPKWT